MRWAALLAVSSFALAAPLTAQPAPKIQPWGIDLAAMDRGVKPGDDFFRYVNGHWLDTVQIAADRTSAGVDVVLADEAETQVRAIAEEGADRPVSPAEKQIGDLYASWMDEGSIEKQGLAPLRPWLARIAALGDVHGLAPLMAQPGYAAPITTQIYADINNPGRYGLYIGRGGLGMPGRDYYLLKGERYDAYRAAYRAHVARQLTLAGFPGAQARADGILALETALATSQWTPERERDVQQTNNPMTVASLQALCPQVDWAAFFKAEGFASLEQVTVNEPDAVQDAGRLLASTPLGVWKDYLAFHFIRDHARFLPRAFDEANFDFYSKTLSDQPQQRPRWKRGVALVNEMLGEAVGRIYVERHYPPASDAQVKELIGNLRAAMSEELQHLSWMDEPTRKQALDKLATFDPRTGHPAQYIDYGALPILRGDLLGDALRSEAFAWQLQLSRFTGPVDRGLWDMTPQTVNAYYDPTVNQITFPAAILQAPYFDPGADPAVNYGAIGAVIGHEMGHGFDDQGRLYDATGKVRDWWTGASANRFKRRTAMLGKQFDSYEPLPGLHVKGDLTMGENVGDLGGLEMAWGAWRRYMAAHGDPGVKNGFTADQRFFLAYSYAWQTRRRDGTLRAQVLTNEHSPEQYRVNGIVRNFDPWYQAFDVKPGDKLYLPVEQRVHIWVD